MTKISDSILTTQLHDNAVIDRSSLFRSVVGAKIYIYAFFVRSFVRNPRVPSVTPIDFAHTCVSRGIVSLFRAVKNILLLANSSKIILTIIQSIAIYVVGVKAVRGAVYNAMHPNKSLFSVNTNISSCITISSAVPFVSRNRIVLPVINFSEFISGELNKLHKIIITDNGWKQL